MLFVLGLFGLSVASVALLVEELRSAPEGYEDHNGFHIIDKPATSFKPSIFKTPRIANASHEKPAVIVEKRAPKVTREVGLATSATQ
jgi:hypothetical protein